MRADSLEDAMSLVEKRRGRLGKTSLNRFHLLVLQKLCRELNLTVAATGKKGSKPIKQDHIDALVDYVSLI